MNGLAIVVLAVLLYLDTTGVLEQDGRKRGSKIIELIHRIRQDLLALFGL